MNIFRSVSENWALPCPSHICVTKTKLFFDKFERKKNFFVSSFCILAGTETSETANISTFSPSRRHFAKLWLLEKQSSASQKAQVLAVFVIQTGRLFKGLSLAKTWEIFRSFCIFRLCKQFEKDFSKNSYTSWYTGHEKEESCYEGEVFLLFPRNRFWWTRNTCKRPSHITWNCFTSSTTAILEVSVPVLINSRPISITLKLNLNMLPFVFLPSRWLTTYIWTWQRHNIRWWSRDGFLLGIDKGRSST